MTTGLQWLSFCGGVNESWTRARVLHGYRWSPLNVEDGDELERAFALLKKLLDFFGQAFPGWETKHGSYYPLHEDISVWHDLEGNLIAVLQTGSLCDHKTPPSHFAAFCRGTLIASGTFFNCAFDPRPHTMNPDRWMWDILTKLLEATVKYAEQEGRGRIESVITADMIPVETFTICAEPADNSAFWK